MPPLPLSSKEEKIIDELTPLLDAPALLLHHLMELGGALPPLSPEEKKAAHLVPGCLSRVWLLPEVMGTRLFFRGHAEALITAGLLALLLILFAGEAPQAIRAYTPTFLTRLRLDQLLGAQRRSGFPHMIAAFHQAAAQMDIA